MFEQSFVAVVQESRKGWSLLFSLALQVLALAGILLASILFSQSLPVAHLRSFVLAPAPPPPEPPHMKVVTTETPVKTRTFSPAALTYRQLSPRINSTAYAEPAPDISSAGGFTSTDPLSSSLLFATGGPTPNRPPAIPSNPAPSHPAAVRIGGQVAEANLIERVQPAYPQLARTVRVEGTVEFSARISKTGRVEQLQLLRGHPLLINEAKRAIEQWRYRPTLLNGEPVEVLTTITVHFKLSN